MMKQILKIILFAPVAALMFVVDVQVPGELQPPSFQLVSEAQAIAGVRRRSFRRGVVIGASAGAAGASATTASQQQAAPAPQQPAPAPQQPGALPIGTVVSALPAGCAPLTVGGVEYQHCGVDYYRAAFQGNNLVYVTSQP